ncbi:MAG: prealbumin-like fold domain-containing protein, partial [Actinomycetota bacterium]
MTTSLRLLTLTVAAALIWALAPPTPARAATETPVLTTPAGEFQPVRGENHLAWEQNTRARPNSFDVLVRPDGGSPIRANRGGKNGALGDIDGERLVYQEFRKRKSDLFFFNLTTGQRSRLPKAVNKRHWEYWPSLSDPWLLFARWNMKRDWRRLFLYNLETGERRVLARTRAERAFIGPGQVNEDYVVWSTCPPKGRCQVYRYHIPTGSKVRMPNPGAHQRAPSVTPEGTVYLRRGSKRCGNSVSLVRIDATGSVVLVDFPEAIDSGDTYAYTDQNGVTHLYYERVGCGGRAASDIHTLTDPELATLSVAVSGTGTGTVTSSPPGIVCGADCLADFPGGTQVTLQADPDPDSYFAGWAGACSGTGDCTLSMDGAKSVTATFHLAGSIAVVKDAVPDDGVDFEFDPSPNLQSESFFLDDDVDPTLPNQQTFSGLTAGTYTIQEVNLPSGWQIAGLECVGDEDGDTTTGASLATINLDPGEDIECTFTNAREGSITIVKDALPDDPQDFQFDPSPNLQNTNFVLDDDPGDGTWPREEPFNELDVPDTYTVTEVNIPDDWQLTDITCTGGGSNTTTAGATATIGLDAGEAVVCT